MPGPVFLHGETVTLHPVEEADLDFCRELVNHPDVRRTLGMSDPTNAHQEEEWFENANENDGEIPFLVVADDDRVGQIGFHVRDHWDASVGVVGYFFHPEAWGNGYATDATRTACRYAFRERGFDKVVGQVFAHNDASRRVLEKVGFRHEGTHRNEAFAGGELIDVDHFGLLPEELED
jgi:RimJ/RimL family protein N-acetyltransferase